MPKVTNQQIAKAFRRAKAILSSNEAENGWETGRQEYICWALGISSGGNRNRCCNAETKAAKEIIIQRIHPEYDLRNWLAEQLNVDPWTINKTKMQEYRHAWMDSLIAEFSTKK